MPAGRFVVARANRVPRAANLDRSIETLRFSATICKTKRANRGRNICDKAFHTFRHAFFSAPDTPPLSFPLDVFSIASSQNGESVV